MPRGQIVEVEVMFFRLRPPVIPGDVRENRNLLIGESIQARMSNQIVRMLVMALVRDVNSDLVEQGRILQHLPFLLSEAV